MIIIQLPRGPKRADPSNPKDQPYPILGPPPVPIPVPIPVPAPPNMADPPIEAVPRRPRLRPRVRVLPENGRRRNWRRAAANAFAFAPSSSFSFSSSFSSSSSASSASSASGGECRRGLLVLRRRRPALRALAICLLGAAALALLGRGRRRRRPSSSPRRGGAHADADADADAWLAGRPAIGQGAWEGPCRRWGVECRVGRFPPPARSGARNGLRSLRSLRRSSPPPGRGATGHSSDLRRPGGRARGPVRPGSGTVPRGVRSRSVRSGRSGFRGRKWRWR